MPTLNSKLLLRVIAVVVLLAGGLALLYHVQSRRVPDALLWQANTAAENGKTDKAIIYMRQYLELRPDDYDTAVRLADLMVERATSTRDLTNAHFLYERVLREAPDRADVGRKLIALSLRLGRHGDAQTHAERLLKDAPNDGTLLAQVGECLLAQNRPAEAKPMLEKAITSAPDNVRAYDLYARSLVRHFNKPKEAEAILDRMVRANPGDAEAFLIRARFLKQVNRPDDCMRDLDRVLAFDAKNGEALVMSAEILQGRGEIRRARDTLKEVVNLYPRYAHGYRALSWLELLSGNPTDAQSTLERGVAAIPDAPELLTPLADLWVEQGELERVQSAIQKLDARKDAATRVSYLRGRLLMKQGKWNEALALLDGLRTEATALPSLATQLNVLVANCHERRGDREAQIEALKRALATDPHHLGARVALANCYLNAGRFEDAIKEYQTASRSPFAGVGVQVTYAQLRLSWARVAGVPPEEWAAIGTFLTTVREQNKLAVEPVVVLAEWRAARDDFDGALQLLRDEIATRPDDPRLWTALAATLDRGRGTLAAGEALGQGQLAAGDSIELRLARARSWVDDLQPGRDKRLARLESLSATAGDAERTRLFSGLAEIYGMIRNDPGQLRTLSELATRYGQDLPSRKLLYSSALRMDDESAKTRWRAEIRRLEGAGGKSVEVLDALHAIRGKGADAQLPAWQQLAREVLGALPDSGDARLLLAHIAERRGDAAEAAKHFEAAADLDATNLSYQESRLGYYLRAGQDEMARRTLGRLEADPRINSQRLRAIVEGAILHGGPDALSKCLGWLNAHLKREPRSAVWAGRLLESRGKVTDALAVYRQVTENCPKFADGWSVRLLASAKLGDAEVNETTASAAKALDRKAFFGVCAESGAAVRGKVPSWTPPATTAEDRKTYAQVCLTACEARGRLEDAVPVLTAFAEDKDARPEDVAWAKRTLAALTAAMGAPDQRKDAVGVLRDSGDRPRSVEDARTRAAALAVAFRTVSGDDRRIVVREMIGLYAFIVRDAAATSNDWFQLAQLYRVVGDRPECRRCLQELTKREPRNLFYLAVNVDDLVGDYKLDEARPLVARLTGAVSDLRVASAVARFHTLANEPKEVLDVVDRYVRAADAGTADGVGRQRQAAELLDQLSRVAAYRSLSSAKPLLDAACERYRASLRAFPEAVIPMAALLAFHGQVQPAFDELERQKTKLSPTALVTGGVAVLRSGHATPQQFQMVKAWISEALAKSADTVPLKLNLGELHTLQQDFAMAEQVYRDVLKTDPKNLVALNNLAWILAPRPETADQALKFADRAIELHGATGEMLDTRARILISAGKYDRAVADLTDAINQSGTPLRYFHLAVAQLRMSKTDDAVRTFKEARARGLDAKAIHPHDLPTFKALSTRADGVQ